MACWGTASSRSVTTRSGAPPARRLSTQTCCWRRVTWKGRDQAPRFVVFPFPGALPGTPLTPATSPPSTRRHHHSALYSNRRRIVACVACLGGSGASPPAPSPSQCSPRVPRIPPRRLPIRFHPARGQRPPRSPPDPFGLAPRVGHAPCPHP